MLKHTHTHGGRTLLPFLKAHDSLPLGTGNYCIHNSTRQWVLIDRVSRVAIRLVEAVVDSLAHNNKQHANPASSIHCPHKGMHIRTHAQAETNTVATDMTITTRQQSIVTREAIVIGVTLVKLTV